jgi:hypothetical protein
MMPSRISCLSLLACILTPLALAAQLETGVISATQTVETLSPLAALVPLGISPFLALGLFGLASSQLEYALPPALSALAHPVLWVGLLSLAVLFKVGRSFKLTKPVAEVAGTTESLLAFVAFAAMFVTPGEPASPAAGTALEASVAGTIVLVVGAVSGLVAVTLVRMGIDLLTWLSPLPLIDALLQFAKGIITLILVATAVLLPAVAVLINALLLVATVFVARWLYRVARFMVAVLWDRTWGTFSPLPVTFADQRLGPVQLWALESGDRLPRFAPVEVWWTPSSGWVARAFGSTDARPLGASTEVSLVRGFVGTTLATPRGVFLFTARHAGAMETVSRVTGTPLGGRAGEPDLVMRTI